jgi:hypothetical protein
MLALDRFRIEANGYWCQGRTGGAGWGALECATPFTASEGKKRTEWLNGKGVRCELFETQGDASETRWKEGNS